MRVNFTFVVKKIKLPVISCFLLLSFTALTAYGQTTHRSPAAIKAETRKSKREAARTEADYKESHLNTAHYTLKKGKAGRKAVRVNNMPADFVFDKEINEIDREALSKLNKKKKLPKSKKSKNNTLTL